MRNASFLGWLAKYQSRSIDGDEKAKGGDQTPSTAPPSPSSAVATPPSDFPRTSGQEYPISTPPSPPLLNSSDSALQELDREASQLILNALERGNSAQSQLKPPEIVSRPSSSFGRNAFSSMIGGLSSLSLSRSNTNSPSQTGDDKESRGRSMNKDKPSRSSSAVNLPETDSSRSRSRARSQSPFSFRRFRSRDPSPALQRVPVPQYDSGYLSDSGGVDNQSSFADDLESGDETVGETDAETDDENDCSAETTDPLTERNTERNTFITVPPEAQALATMEDADVEPDPLGEGVNVVVPPEPYFPSTLNFNNTSGSGTHRGRRNPRRRKTSRHEILPIQNSRPIFQRDRCTIVITQGEPDSKLDGRRRRTYIVASDLSEESRYAVEWGIGTVVRDGDELIILTIVENEQKVDPAVPNVADRTTRLRSQQERQGLSYILVRQATSLLQRTKLHVRVSCQAWHAKNARHMLLDIVDYYEPTMLIVGSRGLGRLKGILLGSTSHYLIQKCSVPVMVARRRLKRPPRRSAHLLNHRTHVSLAEAGIDRVAAKVDRDTKTMMSELSRDDDRMRGIAMTRDDGHGGMVAEVEEPEDEVDDDNRDGVKVAG